MHLSNSFKYLCLWCCLSRASPVIMLAVRIILLKSAAAAKGLKPPCVYCNKQIPFKLASWRTSSNQNHVLANIQLS